MIQHFLFVEHRLLEGWYVIVWGVPGQYFNAWSDFNQRCFNCLAARTLRSSLETRKLVQGVTLTQRTVKLYPPHLDHVPQPPSKVFPLYLCHWLQRAIAESQPLFIARLFKLTNALQIPLELGSFLNHLWYIKLIYTKLFCFTLSQITYFLSELPRNNKMEWNYFLPPDCRHLYIRKLLFTVFIKCSGPTKLC